MKTKITSTILFLLCFAPSLLAQEVWFKSDIDAQNYNLSDAVYSNCGEIRGQLSFNGGTIESWTFGPSVLIGQTPSIISTEVGVHTIKATYDGGKELLVQIEVLEVPEDNIMFGISTTEGCVGTKVKFDSPFPSDKATVQFIIEGNSYPDGVEYTFNSSGRYTIGMQGVTKDGCTFTSIQQNIINIVEPVDIVLLYADSSSCDGALTGNFSIESPDSDAVYSWDFGDGSPIVTGETQVTHNYTDAVSDFYTLKVTATKSDCYSEENVDITLNLGKNIFKVSSGDVYCDAYSIIISSDLSSSYDGQEIEFNIDGELIQKTLPFTPFTREYTVAGETVTIQSELNGCHQNETITIPDLLSNLIQIDGDTIFCKYPYTTNLTIDNSAVLPDTFEFLWEDENGVKTASPSFNDTYNDEQPHEVFLIVKNGTSECIVDTVTVQYAPLDLGINLNGGETLSGCVDTEMILSPDASFLGINFDSLDLEEVSWVVSSNGSEIGNSNNYNYAITLNESGNYDVELTVKTIDGCEHTIIDEIGIVEELFLTFEFSTSIINGEKVFEFINTTDLSGLDLNYLHFWWDVGNGWEEADPSGDFSHIFDHNNVQEVYLKAEYFGCETISEPENVNGDGGSNSSGPYAAFDTLWVNDCYLNSLQVENTSTKVSEYTWTITDGTTTNTLMTTDAEEFIDVIDILGGDILGGQAYTLTLESIHGTDAMTFTLPVKPEPNITWSVYQDNDNLTQVVNENIVQFFPGEGFTFDDGLNLGNTKSIEWTFTSTSNTIISTELTPTIEFPTLEEYTVSLKIVYNKTNDCETIVTAGPIEFYTAEVDSFMGNIFVCLDRLNPTSETYSVSARFNGEDISKLKNVRWEWKLQGDNGDVILKSGDINDFNTAGQILEHTFTETRNDQSDPFKIIYLLKVDGLRASSKNLARNIFVTSPELNMTDPSNHFSFYYECDAVTTFFNPLVNLGNVLSPLGNDTTYDLVFLDTNGTPIPNLTISDNRAYIADPEYLEFTIIGLPNEEVTFQLTVTDWRGCSTKMNNLTFTVPDVPSGEASFSPYEDVQIACRDLVTFTDLANGTLGNTIPRLDENGDPIKIVKWFWYIKDDTNTTSVVETYDGKLENLFIAGEYEVKLMVEDERQCQFTSNPVKVSVGGIRGDFSISKKIGYAPFVTDFIANTTFVSDSDSNIDYTWYSGDGFSETSGNTFSYTYDSITDQNRTAKPGLLFRDINGCDFLANQNVDVQILVAPKTDINDFIRCTAAGDTLIDASDPDFVPANYNTADYKYTATTHYQWYVDGAIISSAEGNNSSNTLTYGTNDIDPFTINPDDADGKKYVVKSWIEAKYEDKWDNSFDHLESVAVRYDTFSVVYEPQPIAIIEKPDTVCKGKGTTLNAGNSGFGDYSRGQILSYDWEVESWGTVTTTTPTLDVAFVDAGTFNITLTVHSNNSCASNTTTETIEVAALPVVDFASDSVCYGFANVFDNLTTLEGVNIKGDSSIISHVKWYFDYQSIAEVTSNEINPSYTFPSVGDHVVKLEVNTNEGCLDSLIKTIKVNSLPAITYQSDYEICDGDTATLMVSGGESYLWSTGETGDSILVSPSVDTNYTFVATNEFGCELEYEIKVKVKPVYELELSFSEPCVGEVVRLDGTSNSYDDLIETYEWNVESWGTVTTTTPTLDVSFADAGTYNITLTVLPIRDCSSNIITKTIEVKPLPVVDFSSDSVCYGFANVFDNLTTLEGVNIKGDSSIISHVKWYFDYQSTAESTSNEINPSYTFPSVGDHVVKLEVYTNEGCLDSLIKTITVNSLPAITYQSDYEICDGDTATLMVSGGESYLWSTGETGDSILVSPSVATNYTFVATNEFGCELEYEIKVKVKPVYALELSFSEPCVGEVVTLDGSSNSYGDLIETYEWNVESWGTVTTTTPTLDVAFADAGTYNITLTVLPIRDCSSNIITKTIEVKPLSIVDFSSDSVCYGFANVFDNQTTLEGANIKGDSSIISHVKWYFDYQSIAEVTSDEISPSYTFPSDGDHVVKLEVYSKEGCLDSLIKTITVNSLPAITYQSDYEICDGDTATLMVSGGESYLWSTGETGDSILVSPSVDTNYTFIATNEFGCEVEYEIKVKVKPVYALELSFSEPCVGEVVTLDGSSNSYGDLIETYEWNVESWGTVTTTTPTLDVAFADAGTYNITLTILPIRDCSSNIITKTIEVKPLPVVDFSSDSVCYGFANVFDNLTTLEGVNIKGDSSIISHVRWYFDYQSTAESTSNEINPSYTFPSVGDHVVKLEVYTNEGCLDSLVKTITVNSLPAITYQSDYEICDGDTATLMVSGGESYLWSTGETGDRIMVSPSVDANYTFVATNEFGCELEYEIKVKVKPVYALELSFSEPCVGEVVTLDGTSASYGNLIETYEWNVESWGTVTTTTPTLDVAFADAGIYNITLTVLPIRDCSSNIITKTIEVKPLPVVDFASDSVCYGFANVFDNLTTLEGVNIKGDSSIISHVRWYFDYQSTAESTSNEINPSYTFPSVGDHVVKLEVYTNEGCMDSLIRIINLDNTSEITYQKEYVICEGEATTITVAGGNSYLWNTGETTESITVSPLEDTKYTFVATNVFGCESEHEVKVVIIPTYDSEVITSQHCEGEVVTLDGRVEFNGVYEWSNGSTQSEIEVTESGTYEVLYHLPQENGKECTSSKTFEVEFYSTPRTFTNIDTTHCFKSDSEITLTAPAGDDYIYLWEDTNETTQSVSREEEGRYFVRIIDTSNETECVTYTSITVTEVCLAQLFTPTAMTPNYDGLNDEFLIRSRHAINIKLNIYNRWGEIIFSRTYANSSEARQEGNGWDGMYRGQLVPGGVYTYSLDYVSELTGEAYRGANTLTVIR